MEQTLRKPKVKCMAEFCYSIESKDIEADKVEKRKGFIVRERGKITTIPFKKGNGETRRQYDVRTCGSGKLSLSAKRQRITLKISLDREKDSPEEFRKIFEELIDGYVMDVIKKEIEECLD